ncbi:hypothetical protein GAYE_SCF28MG4727 [Galdieria yellowstonensis]|uniref:NEDD8-activating enzyme E1 regulatory subunit n=1 Tax=Galdieria yellowstonensis TaxID=3028027 RepID=A0AAV9IH63_9RHOD|nr:hypothetical protein GAYE_SCF28MG4727 [Galdieria yellowstonensis]
MAERYDRQIRQVDVISSEFETTFFDRFWGEHGQSALKNCSVYLLEASATGTETLKNLILPGVGSFTVIDDKETKWRDLGRNFFVDQDAATSHLPRAETTRQWLQELNDEVLGHSLNISIDSFLEEYKPEDGLFPVFVCCSLDEQILWKTSEFCWRHQIPFIYAVSCGFFGFVRIAIPEHCVWDTREELVSQELRLSEPFEELEQYCNNFPLESMDDTNHSLVPYAVILVKALKAFKDSHQGRRPESREDQETIRALLKSWMRTATEENFVEALKHCHFIKSSIEPNESLQRIFNDSNAEVESIRQKVYSKDRNLEFWILVAAVKQFFIEEHKLPLKGSVPDMISDTESFVGLQRVYKKRAEKEHWNVYRHVENICKQVGLETNFLSPCQVFEFCRNIRSIAVMRYYSIQEEMTNGSILKDALGSCLARNEQDAYLYVAFRCYLKFYQQQGRFPGQVMDGNLTSPLDYEQDYLQLVQLAEEYSETCDIEKLQVYLKEMCRCGDSELHSIAALTGGIAAQEVVKIITKQFQPLRGWFIFNGARSTSVTIPLCT